MAGVGSTNAMKKGSGNNPFLAFSEADMRGYLNSAYTGCIVKYSGEAIKRQITDINKTVGEYAQNLVFDTTKLGVGAIVLPAAIKIDITKNGASTTQYIYEGWVKDGKVYSSAVTGSTNMLVLASSLNSGADVIAIINNGRWQREAVNDQGKLTLWSYSEDVLFTVIPDANGSLAPFERFVSIVPYIVGELYKVVYGDGVYYYEEFYYISEDRTTGNSDYLAPGKTMYDFTGSLQTGNGNKINPYIANTVDEMNSYLTLAYKGAFVKYVGTSTADYTNGAVYQVADDGDTTRYAILPTLSNKGKASDLAAGKQLINSQGEVMEGEAATQGDIVAKYANKQLTEFVTTAELSGIGQLDYSAKDRFITMQSQSLLKLVSCPNVKTIYASAFTNCPKLSKIDIPENVSIHNIFYYNGAYNPAETFPQQLYESSGYTTYVNLGNNDEKFSIVKSMYTYASSLPTAKRLLAGAVSGNVYSILHFDNVKYVTRYAFYSCASLKELYLPNVESLPAYTVSSCPNLSYVDLTNVEYIDADALNYCSKLISVNCPNVKYIGGYAFGSALSFTGPFSFDNVITFKRPYHSSLSISSLYLPKAEIVDIATTHLESVYMPNVKSLSFSAGIISELSLSVCEKLVIYKATELTKLFAPAVITTSMIQSTALSMLSLPAATYASGTTSVMYIEHNSVLTSVYLPNYEQILYLIDNNVLQNIYCPKATMINISGTILLSSITLGASLQSISMYGSINGSCAIDINSPVCSVVQITGTGTGTLDVTLTNVQNVNGIDKSAYIYLSNSAINTLNINITSGEMTPYTFRLFAKRCKKLIVNKSLSEIGASWFYQNRGLVDISLPNITYLSYSAFAECSDLKEVYLPKLSSLGTQCLKSCHKLEYLILPGSTKVTTIMDAIDSTPMSLSSYVGHFGSIYVPASLVSTYKAATNWSRYSSRITSITDLPQELKDKYNLNGVE